MDSEPDASSPAASHSDPPSALPVRSVSFFAALRKIQSEQAALIGRDTRPAHEPVRLRSEPSVAFPSTELAKATTSASGQVVLDVSFLGLFGPSGTLPQHYTQTIIDRGRQKDYALRDFLNLFNHRWISFFYRAWEKHDFPSAFQTSRSLKQEDPITKILSSLVGFGTSGLRDRTQLDDSSLLYYAGLLADTRARQTSLTNMIADWFKVSVEVLQFQGQWIHISVPDQTRMQAGQLGVNSNNRLGFDTVAGQRVWNVENRLRLKIGPLNVEEFRRFSPMGDRLAALHALARTYLGPQMEFDIQVVLQRQSVPPIRLGSSPNPSHLGWNTWLGNWPFARDAQDAIFELEDTASLSSG
ncbi:type VI secretion system baseplate subunit TssG [Aureliella helgolandensis]|uniref:Type VI secretion protein, VC_A0111 family n=1 Tax=Aureliella helgolandensis TaxID=2527968 RepID=A0A518GAI6_9BACT|nr:type VI secretion system baseplate subunit TssG [Aureliella helgolandensis]QDV25573.1 hypothetical protein Q31a_38990 [Aureliella helgolandensis]